MGEMTSRERVEAAFRKESTDRVPVHHVSCSSSVASDGDLWSVADDLFGATSVDGFYEIDRRAGMDHRLLRASLQEDARVLRVEAQANTGRNPSAHLRAESPHQRRLNDDVAGSTGRSSRSLPAQP